MNMNSTKHSLQQLLPHIEIQEAVVLAPYSTFKMGGPAELYITVHEEKDLIAAIQVAHALSLPVRVLGGASNVVISDEGINGLVIRNMCAIKSVMSETSDTVRVHISSGYSMTRLAKETAELGWSGFEHHLGLPGTLGGALYMNSKWVDPDKTYYVGDALVSAQVISPDGQVKQVDKDYFNFGYDYSILQDTRETVISAVYELQKKLPEHLVAAGKKSLAYRRATQPHGVATSGCFFKNVNGKSAGKMIDDAGLKGYRVGGAFVSDVHANFILNDGSATTNDVRELLHNVKEKIKSHYGVELEQEVDII
ncbi:MAG: UDP-N-acetylenolpyruvoylglucosamine reductase [Microgenomates bacterium OLB23]|nr:MAG: UDP-N-acetylenolpyruvoylglucosamine reductase [Microgenomates bacterium OLB23]